MNFEEKPMMLFLYLKNHLEKDNMERFHFLNTDIIPPQRFTYPFNYTPHPLCIKAAQQLQKYIASVADWKEEIEGGKMFGVLVAKDADGRIGFLAAYSGLLAGRNDWQFFVPPVYDSQQPDGYFKTHEREISAINAEIKTLQNDEELVSLHHRLNDAEKKAEGEIAEFKALMAMSKDRRDERRRASEPLTDDIEAEMTRESQYQKAELKRIRKRNRETVDAIRKSMEEKETAISNLKKLRKELSDALQHWLFEQYDMLNAKGEHRNLCRIFADTPQGVPPSGAGDCCAPKLLQYAYQLNCRPLCMAEFWWGNSPKREIRHHLHYYPACRSKCKPILGFMLQGLDLDPDPHDSGSNGMALKIIYEDKDIIVVSKPSGILSMPGLVDRECVADVLKKELGDGYYMPAHRLDMDTSGLLVVARNEESLRRLHEQFAARKVEKRYTAVLDGTADIPKHGFIRLPLSADENDRPRQVVDKEGGKAAVTEYTVERTDNGKTYIKLIPHTGRTHQLRVHCAHADGLAMPISGDRLYGHPSDSRLMLHAEYLSFHHPITGERLRFYDEIE